MKRIVHAITRRLRQGGLFLLIAAVLAAAIPLAALAAFVFPGTAGFTIIDDGAAAVQFLGNAWTTVADESSHGGTSRQNRTADGAVNGTAAALLTFTGTAVKVYGRTRPDFAGATYTVYNDGGENRWEYLAVVPDVSSQSGEERFARELIRFTGLENREHKLRIVADGLMDIDFFEVSADARYANPTAVSLDVPAVTMKQYDYQTLQYALKAADGSYIARRPVLSSNDVDALETYASSPSTTRITGDGGILALEWGRSSITAIDGDLEVKVPVTVEKIVKQPLRRTVDKDNFLYLENYYWGDDLSGSTVLDLWSTVPDSLKPHTVILLIAERSIQDEEFMLAYGQERGDKYHKSREWIEYNTALCNDYGIPVAIQAVNGETGMRTIPVEWYDALAKTYPNVQGLNGAEMYNGGFSWGNDFINYMTQLTRVCVENGLHLMWTDTAMSMVSDWIQGYAPMERLFRENKEHIILMNKQSFSDPGSEALYKGLWLTDYCGNWGVASDWWNWQINGCKLYYEGVSLGALAQCYAMPEVRYAQDILRVMSQGATAFKSEAQWFSNATLDMRMPAYQRAILPLLERIASGDVRIPSKDEVIGRTKALAVGRGNWVSTYDNVISNVNPYDSALGIVPYTVTTTPASVLEKLRAAGMTLFDASDKMTADKARAAYAGVDYLLDVQGTAGGVYKDGYLETYGDGTWYWQSTYDNREVTQSSAFAPVKAGADKVSITAGSHSMAIFIEEEGRLGVYLNNYRYVKDDLRAMDPPDAGPCDEAYYYSHRLARQLRDNTVPEGERHETVLEITASAKPAVVFAPVDEFTNPYDADLAAETVVEWDAASKTATIVIRHNGPVAFDVVLDGSSAAASRITLDETALTLERGRNATLKASVNADAANRSVTWTSDNPDAVSVSPYGVIYAAGAGTAVITATTADGTTARCAVTVPDPVVTAIASDGGTVTLDRDGDAFTLRAQPDAGYIVGAVVVDGVDHTVAYRAENQLQLTPDADMSVEVLFAGGPADDTAALRAAVAAMAALDEAAYDGASYAALADAIAAAQALLEHGGTPNELAAAVNRLFAARGELCERTYYTAADPVVLPATEGERRAFEAEHAVLDVTVNRRYAKLVYHDSEDGTGRHTVTASGGVFVGDFAGGRIAQGNALRFAFDAPEPGIYTFLPRFRGSGAYTWSGTNVTPGSTDVAGAPGGWTVGAFQVEVTAAGPGEIIFTAPSGGMPATDRFEAARGVVEAPPPEGAFWVLVDDDHPSVAYTGGYSRNADGGCSGGYDTFLHAGAEAVFTFTGTGVRYYSQLDPAGGTADVYLDGVRVIEGLSYKSVGLAQTQVLRYENTALPSGGHTLRIVRTSGGSASSQFVSIDHFEYINDPS